MAVDVIHKNMKITFYGCKDCMKVYTSQLNKNIKTLRPNNKFCDPLCRDYVINQEKIKAGQAIDVPNEPGDEIETLKLNFEILTKKFEELKKDFDTLKLSLEIFG